MKKFRHNQQRSEKSDKYMIKKNMLVLFKIQDKFSEKKLALYYLLKVAKH